MHRAHKANGACGGIAPALRKPKNSKQVFTDIYHSQIARQFLASQCPFSRSNIWPHFCSSLKQRLSEQAMSNSKTRMDRVYTGCPSAMDASIDAQPRVGRIPRRSLDIRPYLGYVKCRFHIRFHIGLYIQGLGITDGNISG